jgi:glutamate--cysteine ligase
MSLVKKILSEKFQAKNEEINNFFAEKYSLTKPLFYSSVDIRHSGNKIVPVDTNLFPAGFNLLSENQANKATDEVKKYLDTYYQGKNKIIIIAEAHDRNKFYLQNLKTIKNIVEKTGAEVNLARLDIENEIELETADGSFIKILPITRNNENKLSTPNFTADLIISNNDFSSGSPDILKKLSQPIFPPVGMGWYRRRKTSHFDTYEILAREFCRKIDVDLFHITALFRKCGKVNFKSKDGLDCVSENVNEILRRLKAKYREYKIEQEPYVFIKANSGTYGMGIMVVKSAAEVLEINKKERHSMNNIKEGVENTEVVIQEGVPTIDEYEGKPAEPMAYLVNGNVISCNYRINSNQDAYGNLNSKGMSFVNFECTEENRGLVCPVEAVIARLASLAGSQECYEINWEI